MTTGPFVAGRFRPHDVHVKRSEPTIAMATAGSDAEEQRIWSKIRFDIPMSQALLTAVRRHRLGEVLSTAGSTYPGGSAYGGFGRPARVDLWR
jgi:hypothetical protein